MRSPGYEARSARRFPNSGPLATMVLRQPTSYPHINHLLRDLTSGLEAVFENRLVGVYLYGSLVTGDYDDGVSDVDLLAVLRHDIDEHDLVPLDMLHRRLIDDHPEWNDRIEVAYLSLAALRTFRSRTSRIGIISPGEPLHFRQAGRDWLMNWYLVRDRGMTLVGPPPQEIIPPVSVEEFIASVLDHAQSWHLPEEINVKPQSYVILTMCRTLYTVRFRAHVSKLQAATWVAETLPEWAPLIRDAMRWRIGQPAREEDSNNIVSRTHRFVEVVKQQLVVRRE